MSKPVRNRPPRQRVGPWLWASALGWLCAGGMPLTAAEPPAGFARDVRPLLDRYCAKCHGATKPKGGVDLAPFQDEASIYRDPKLWGTVLAQLRDRTMPPENRPQPSPEERDRLVEWLTGSLRNLDETRLPKDPGRTVIHRLSRFEYNNTVRDLFGVDTRPADKFPADGGGGAGFDNNAATLFIPPLLMEKLLVAAEEVLAQASPERLFIARPGGAVSDTAAARSILGHFAPRVFRQPVEKEELGRLVTAFEAARQRGLSFEAAVRVVLKAMLVSPRFLFRAETEQDSAGPYRVNDYDLASRLSYFLWSSMPDDELFALAAQQRLREPAILEAQARRMIADPKSRAFAENFAGQWLGVLSLNTGAQPDRRRFPSYTPALRDALCREPVEFFHALLRNNGRLLDWLDCDYAFVNEELARHYGLPGVQGAEFRRVPLPDRTRGGVLGMGSVLTLTSYPLRTSPVLRGRWVLEEILGTPPPPPPPLVQSLPPDDRAREGLTFRQQLERHRKDPQCAGCHKRMDPLGLGLENFDAIGRWRTDISGQPVDASGVMVTGEPFNGPAELKQLLLKRRDEFIHNLTEKMLSYALGRGLEYYDAPTVKRVGQALAKDGDRSMTLILEIVRSFPFQHRRNQPIPFPEL